MFFSKVLVLALSVMGAASCSRSGTSTAELTIVRAAITSYTHPAIFLGRNLSTGKRTVRKFESGSDTTQLSLTNGDWRFSVIAWDGSEVFEGVARCFSGTFKLTGAPVVVNADLSRDGCADPVFGGAASFDPNFGFRSVEFNACSTVAHVSGASSTCEGAFRSFNRSFKFGLVQMNEDSGPGKSVAIETACVNAENLTAAISTQLRLPVGDVGGAIELAVKGYPDANCGGTPRTQSLPNGLSGPLSKAYGGTETTWFATSLGALNPVQLYVESGGICDFGAQIPPQKIGNSGYVFRKVGSEPSSFSLMKSPDLSLNSAAVVQSNTGPLLSIQSGLRIGAKYYFVAAQGNDYTTRLFSFGGTVATDLVGTNLTETGDSGNKLGVAKRLVQFDQKLFFSFRSGVSSARELCSVSLLNNAWDCYPDATYLDVIVIGSNATGVFYVAKDSSDSDKLTLLHFNGSSHATKFDLSTLTAVPSLYEVGRNDLLTLGINQYLYLSLDYNQGAIFSIIGATVSPLQSNAPEFPVISAAKFLTSSSSYPMIIEGVGETLTDSADFPATPTMVKPIGTIGDFAYYVLQISSQTNIWAVNSTDATAVQITSFSGVSDFATGFMDGKLYFVPLYNLPASLHVVDNNVSSVVKTISSENAPYTTLSIYDGKIFFISKDPTHGQEPWVSDGTLAGTRILKDLTPGTGDSYGQFIGKFGPYVLYKAYDKVYRSEGTPETTSVFYSHPFGNEISNPLPLDEGVLLPFSIYENMISSRGMIFFRPPPQR